MLTLSWAIFAVNIAIQFPLFIRFGYSRVSLLATFLPLAVVMVALTRLHLSIVTLRDAPELAPAPLGGRRGRDRGVRGPGQDRGPAARAQQRTNTRRPDRSGPIIRRNGHGWLPA